LVSLFFLSQFGPNFGKFDAINFVSGVTVLNTGCHMSVSEFFLFF